MVPEDAAAIADFLSQGGKIQKLREATPVTASEVLDFLTSRGVGVKRMPGRSKTFALGQERLKLSDLITLANKHRHSEQLAPFALRVVVWPAALRKR
jgi:hypothetical protein